MDAASWSAFARESQPRPLVLHCHLQRRPPAEHQPDALAKRGTRLGGDRTGASAAAGCGHGVVGFGKDDACGSQVLKDGYGFGMLGHVQRGVLSRLRTFCKKDPTDARRRHPRRLVRRRRGFVPRREKTTSAYRCTLCCGSSTTAMDRVRMTTIWAERVYRRAGSGGGGSPGTARRSSHRRHAGRGSSWRRGADGGDVPVEQAGLAAAKRTELDGAAPVECYAFV